MSKQLVTIENLDDFICRHSGHFHMDGTRMLTPGAKDELALRGIAIVNDCGCNHPGISCAEAAGGACVKAGAGAAQPEDEEILIAVAATLQKEYGVSDPAKLKEMSLEVVNTLKKNLSVF